MKIGLIGLGKMGKNLALNMIDHNVEVVGYNRSDDKTKAMVNDGLIPAYSIKELMDQLDEEKKVVWLMVPAGKPVDENIEEVVRYMNPGDIIVDGGNSNYKDTLRRNTDLNNKDIFLIDAGTSGGTDGARNGACIMAGGDDEAIEYLESVFKDICVSDGFQHMGKTGSGHFVKMVHNGVEYGMMQAIGEGFEILNESPFELDFKKVSKVWNNGSIISGYLMEMTENAFLHNDNTLDAIAPTIDSSGEGLWTAIEALNLRVAAPVITTALFTRFDSKKDNSFRNRLIAAQRNEFGGHKLHKKDD